MQLNKFSKHFLGLAFIMIFSWSCNQGPKVIEGSNSNTDNLEETSATTGIFESGASAPGQQSNPVTSGIHTIKVEEVLPTEKYVYLRVTEGDEEYWIATARQEVVAGATYFYKNGLLKTNFESKEYNRIFEKVYLVSNIVPVDHGSGMAGSSAVTQPVSQNKASEEIAVEGSVRIAELVNDPSKYAGKEIQISGRCVKINPNIMGRNWIHLKDGSKDDYDLVLTTDVPIPEGHQVTMKGIVALNRDFGAGYKYDIIIENAEIVR